MVNKLYKVPARFEKEIKLHVVSNLISNALNFHVPLILGIHGESGQGKTFQTKLVLESMNIEVFHISGSQLESPSSGAPAIYIKEIYEKAGKSNKNYHGATIIIDDLDAGLGNWGDLFQYTVNSQTVSATLMHLADNPTDIDQKQVKRVPIIVTGNDFTKLYQPLTRAGRMKSFEWKPNEIEKIGMLKSIFWLLDEQGVASLLQEFTEQPISFFSNLHHIAVQDKLWETIKGRELEWLEAAKNQAISKNNLDKLIAQITVSELLEIGQNIVKNSTHRNHLLLTS